MIAMALCEYADQHRVQVIFTTGGTGFAPRDVTPEATKSVIDRECPQLALAMALESFKKTPFAALSRAVCGIREKTLIVNFPGSVKAVRECFESIKMVLPHAIQLIRDEVKLVRKTHDTVQQPVETIYRHVCPNKTNSGEISDRNSPFPMICVSDAVQIVLQKVAAFGGASFREFLRNFEAPVDIPPFRASLKDGYALRSSGFAGVKTVVGCISAGDKANSYELSDDECFKINTGAALPTDADCVVQIEDTKLLEKKADGREYLVEILVEPKPLQDVRPIGCDLKRGSPLFPNIDVSDVAIRSLMASVGHEYDIKKPKIGIISTGSELVRPTEAYSPGKVFDSNTTMLEELLKNFGFKCHVKAVVDDNFDNVRKIVENMFNEVDFVICSGGVSMGDKDYIKPVLTDLGFKLHFGRVNMKPGKPMTFASNRTKYFFGLPGNPVSAFVCFHIFTLSAIRYASGHDINKSKLAVIKVKLDSEKIELDPRPEYVRATITSRKGELLATVTGNQMSSRLQSILGADVLLHLPGWTPEKQVLTTGQLLDASVLRCDFISHYES